MLVWDPLGATQQQSCLYVGKAWGQIKLLSPHLEWVGKKALLIICPCCTYAVNGNVPAFVYGTKWVSCEPVQLGVCLTGLPKGLRFKAGEEYSWHLEGYPIWKQRRQGVGLVFEGCILLLTFGRRRFELAQEWKLAACLKTSFHCLTGCINILRWSPNLSYFTCYYRWNNQFKFYSFGPVSATLHTFPELCCHGPLLPGQFAGHQRVAYCSHYSDTASRRGELVRPY